MSLYLSAHSDKLFKKIKYLGLARFKFFKE